jgi:3-hydroxyacyl-CoA dehydrogenase/enoyl-CoA hydratase/3-hydroxybutyryl-CoA epimerase
MMDTIGLPQVMAECERLQAAYGERFAPPALLRDMAAQGKTFYGATRITSPALNKA